MFHIINDIWSSFPSFFFPHYYVVLLFFSIPITTSSILQYCCSLTIVLKFSLKLFLENNTFPHNVSVKLNTPVVDTPTQTNLRWDFPFCLAMERIEKLFKELTQLTKCMCVLLTHKNPCFIFFWNCFVSWYYKLIISIIISIIKNYIHRGSKVSIMLH